MTLFYPVTYFIYISYYFRIQVLKKVLSTPNISSQFSSEELQVANVFLRDFEKSGIYLPSSDRKQFVHLSDKIIALGRQFTQKSPQNDIDVSLFEGLHPVFSKGTKENISSITTKVWKAQMVLKFVND